MKISILYLSFFITLLSFDANAQNPYLGSVTVFSVEGDNFILTLNGERKNGSPSSRVVVDNVVEVPLSIHIEFENGSIPVLKKSGYRGGKDCVYAIQKNKKGERVLRIKDCTDPFPEGDVSASAQTTTTTTTSSSTTSQVVVSSPAQLSATYSDGVITLNDGRTFTVKKVKVNGMTYPRLLMNVPVGASGTVTYDDNTETYTSEIPFQYEVKDFSNNNSFFRLTVNEGGPEKTWHVRLQNSNGYDLKIE